MENKINSICHNGIEYIIEQGKEVDLSNYYNKTEIDSKIGFDKVENNCVQMPSCTATGQNAVAEGRGTNAVTCSHAEGASTKANGFASHSEGDNTQALGISSHSEGKDTIAQSNYSHAEGFNTKATASYAHSENYDTEAKGQYSHAEGKATITQNSSEHASGQYNISNKQDNYRFGMSGNTLFSIGNGNSITEEEEVQEHRHNAFEVRQNGDIYIPNTSLEGEYYEKPMIKLQDAIIFMKTTNNSAYMITCSANGEYAVSEGYNTSASGNRSHAEGDSTIASGSCSHAEGSYSKATGTGSHAEGANTNSNNYYSHAEGAYTTAKGRYSHSEGYNTKANNDGCHSEGSGATSNGSFSHAEGIDTVAGGYASHVEGVKTITNNSSEHASGQLNESLRDVDLFGSSGNTHFTIGNGAEVKDSSSQETSIVKHNAFEVRQNGDIYISNTLADGEYYEKPMVKLQDAIIQAYSTFDSDEVIAGKQYYNNEAEKTISQYLEFNSVNNEATILSTSKILFENAIVENTDAQGNYYVYNIKYMQTSETTHLMVVSVKAYN